MEKRLIEKKIKDPAISDYYNACSVFQADPCMALVKNRTIIEGIAKALFQREKKADPGTRMLGSLLDLMAKECHEIPPNIIALMRSVNFLGNVGAHRVHKQNSPDIVDTSEFAVSMMSTLKVTDWYINNYMLKE